MESVCLTLDNMNNGSWLSHCRAWQPELPCKRGGSTVGASGAGRARGRASCHTTAAGKHSSRAPYFAKHSQCPQSSPVRQVRSDA